MEGLNTQILEFAPTALVCLDPDGRIVFANPAAARLIGAMQAEDLIGQPVRTYIQFLNLGSAGEDVCVRDDGSSIPIEYESAPILQDGQATGTVMTLRDISERRAAEREQAELISIVSHELRTPLTSIRSAIGLLASGRVASPSLKGQRMLDIAVSNTDRLIRLINQTLDLERVESADARMQHVLLDAHELLGEAADSVRGMADDFGVTIDVAPIDAQLPGDPDGLMQVLINLLSNAIKFSPEEGGTVWLDAERSGSELLIRVRDEGRGIPTDKLETIFERFAQVESADAREKGGTGLGLAICRTIVKQHGGQIWAESAPGAGTTLCVALPCHDVAQVSRAA
jgi:signal transduction histidine kinase